MKTKLKKVFHGPLSKTFEVSEVMNPGTIEQYDRAIGMIIEWGYGFEWEHLPTLRRGGLLTNRAHALKALKKIHQDHKNGLTLKTL